VHALVAAVTNTPWGERHAYVLHVGPESRGVLAGQFDTAPQHQAPAPA